MRIFDIGIAFLLGATTGVAYCSARRLAEPTLLIENTYMPTGIDANGKIQGYAPIDGNEAQIKTGSLSTSPYVSYTSGWTR